MRAMRQEGSHKPARWPAAAAPHGYDRNEFHPGESHRDYPEDPAGERPAPKMSARRNPASRKREPDEERRLLREAAAAFTGPDQRQDMADGLSGDGEGDVGQAGAGKGEAVPSKLYRD